MHELKAKLEEAESQINKGFETLDIEEMKLEIKDLEAQVSEPDFWQNQEHAKTTSKKLADTQSMVDAWRGIKAECEELIEMLESIKAEEDPEGAEDFRKLVDTFFEKWSKLNLMTFLNGKYDRSNAILAVHCGTGGKDAQDFSEMLLRMYIKYAENHEYEVKLIDETTILIQGPYAYGYLKGEAGVQRLIRLSPFNSGNTRETSFALVEVMPEIHEGGEHELDIQKDDLKIDVFRSSGPGGQSVNTTDSAVRVTHLPTGIVISCQNERSQLQNKEQAMKILKGKLVQRMEEEQAEELSQLKGEKTDMSWGHQIRTYTLHPYQLVKDHRTNYEEKQTDKILNDGQLDGFIEALLEQPN